MLRILSAVISNAGINECHNVHRYLRSIIIHWLLSAMLINLTAHVSSSNATSILSPDEYIPTERIRIGMKGYGKTVFKGTRISKFPITVIGVLKAVDFGMDMILIRIDGGPVVTKRWGIVSGMSGSPIYVNGKLIGALAYGWMFSRLPIAGVTPIESMVESATPAPTHFSKLWDDGVTFVPRDGKIRIGRQRIRRVVIAGRGYISKRAHVPRDEIVLTPIRTPLMVSGISGIALERLRALLQPFGLEPVAAPGKPYNADKIKASLEPGAAVGAQMVSGDIDLTAVGTVTYRKGNLLIAFGHPFMLAGSIQMPLTTAYVHGVLPSELMSIKLASPLRPLGAFTEDRAFAIAGKLGLRADMLPVVMTMRDLNRHVQRQYRVAVFRHRDLTIPLINLLLSIAFMNVTSISNSGTTRIAYEIFTDGLPPIRRSNLFIQRRAEGLLGMILSYFIGPTAELVQLLETLQDNRFKPVNIKQVRVLMENTQQRREAYIERVWCDKRVVRPGEDVTLHVFLREVHGDVVERTFKVQVPERMPATTIRIGVAGGEHGARLRSRLGILQRRPLSLKQLIEEFMRRERNDEIVICMQLPNMGGWLNGALTENVPYSVLEMFNAIADDNFYVGYVGKIQRISCSNVVHGMKIVTIRVRPEWVKETPKPSASLRRARGRAFEDLFETFEELRRILGGKGSTMPFQRTLMCKSRTRWLLKHLEHSPDANALSRNIMALLSLMQHWDMSAISTYATSPPSVEADKQEGDEEGRGTEEASMEGEAEETPAPTESIFAVRKAPKGRVWELKSQKQFAKGKCFGAFVASDNSVRIGWTIQDGPKVNDPGIWRAVIDNDGVTYLASWLTGKLYRMDSKGNVEVIHEFADNGAISGVITALAIANDQLLIAVSPGGKLHTLPIKSTSEGNASKKAIPKLWVHLPVEHIWQLQVLPSGDVLAATGIPGRIYRIGRDGMAHALLDARDEHVMALAVSDDGTVYAGTYPFGRLWRISPDGRAKTVYETARGAIQTLCVDDGGNVYIGTTPYGELLRLSPRGNVDKLYDTPSRHIVSIVVYGNGDVLAAGLSPSAIYWTDGEGAAGEVLKLRNEHAMQLIAQGDALRALMAGSGRWAKLVRATEAIYVSPIYSTAIPTEWHVLKWIADLPEGTKVLFETRSGSTNLPDETWSDWQPTQSMLYGERVQSPPGKAFQFRVRLLTTNGKTPRLLSTKLSLAPVNIAPKVQITSPAPGSIWSKTKTIKWKASDPNGDELEYEVYYSSDGGKTWQRLKKAKRKAKDGKAGKTKVQPVGEKETKSEKPTRKGAVSIEKWGGTAGEPPRDATKVAGKEKKPVKGKTGIEIEMPPMPEISEELMEELETAEEVPTVGGRTQKFEWDTKRVPDGRYLIKVRVTDVLSNPLNPLTAEAISLPVVVDNTPPRAISPKPAEVVTEAEKEEKGKVKGEAKRKDKGSDRDVKKLAPQGPPPTRIVVRDDMTWIARAEYRVDKGDWQPLVSVDRTFDTPEEELVILVERLPDGEHMLEVRVYDAAGNAVTLKYPYKKVTAKGAGK